MEMKQKKEVMAVLGARVFKKHRTMIRTIAKNKKLKDGTKIKGEGAVVRIAIEKLYASETN